MFDAMDKTRDVQSSMGIVMSHDHGKQAMLQATKAAIIVLSLRIEIIPSA